MSLRINFMHSSEMRHSGAVRRSFLIRIAAVAAVCVVALLLLFMMFEARSTGRELEKLQASFKEVEQTYNELKVVQENLAFNSQVTDELDTWMSSRIIWNESLMDIQALVPPEVRFDAIEISSMLSLLEQKGAAAPAAAPAEGEEPEAAAPAKAPPAPVPIRTYRIYFAGNVMHESANRVIVGFVEGLRRGDRLGPLFQSVKLQRMDKNTEQGAGENEHLFAVEAVSHARKMVKEKSSP